MACWLLAAALLSLPRFAHAQPPAAAILGPGLEDRVQALVAPLVQDSEITPQWWLRDIAIQRDRIVYALVGPGGQKATLALSQPQPGATGHRSASFLLTREPLVQQGPAAAVLERLEAAVIANDHGGFWQVAQPRSVPLAQDTELLHEAPQRFARQVVLPWSLGLLVLLVLLVWRRKRTPEQRQLLARRLLLGGVTLLLLAGLLALAEGQARRSRGAPDAMAIAFHARALGLLEPCDAARQLAERPPGSYAIGVLGESSAHLLGSELETLARHPGTGLRVARCGQVGAGLLHVERQFAELVAARPDAIVLVFGHNLEFDYPASRLPIWLAWLGAHSRLLHPGPGPGPLQPALGSLPQETPHLRAFKAFLRSAADIARRQHIQLVLTTLTPNYWLPPGQQPPPGVDVQLLEAQWLRSTGQHAQAIARLEAVAQRVRSPRVEFDLGQWLAQDGRRDAARDHLERALQFSWRDRVVAATNAAIRAVAAQEHLLLRDTLGERERAASDGIPGWESLTDRTHLYPEFFAQEALAIVRLLGRPTAALGEALPDPPQRLLRVHEGLTRRMREPATPDTVRNQDRELTEAYARLLSELSEDAAGQLQEAVHALATTPQAVPLRERVLAAAAQAAWQAGRKAMARQFSQQRLELARGPRLAMAWVQKGLFDLEEGRRDAAAASFERAVAADSTNRDAQFLAGKARKAFATPGGAVPAARP